MYSTVGINTITHSQFVSSSPNSKVSGSFTGGGGLYIEFAYCYRNMSCSITFLYLHKCIKIAFLKLKKDVGMEIMNNGGCIPIPNTVYG